MPKLTASASLATAPRLRLYSSGPLTASVADRTVKGVLLPFGEWGLTSLGKVTASTGSLTIAPTLDPLTLEHVDADIVGEFLTLEETPAGFVATAKFRDDRAGDAALDDVLKGHRRALSVEVAEDGLIIRGGQIIAGTITGGSLVRTPAFPSARLTATKTPTVPDTDPKEPTMDEDETTTATTPAPAPATPATGGLTAAAPPATRKTDTKTLFAAIAALAASGGSDAKLRAALHDIVPGDILGTTQPTAVGELWSGAPYNRQVIPLYNHADLTNMKVAGWRWATKPAVAPYAGGKTEVPSNRAETVPVEIAAKRYAGAHDVDRAFVDFPNPEFWAAYFAAMTESAKRVSDAMALADIKAEATPIVHGTVPDGAPLALVKIVDGILAVLNATDTVADHALISTDLWREMLFVKERDVLVYLDAMLGFEDGSLKGRFTIKPTAQLASGEVLVGCKSAVTVHELGGEAPIRIQAPNVPHGGVDAGVFGYLAVNVHDPNGLALVTSPPPVAP